jgi:alpha-glucosidase
LVNGNAGLSSRENWRRSIAGDETGMEQVSIPSERIQDPFEKLVKGFDIGPDPERAPLRWDDTKAGGFTTGEPWLPPSEERSRNFEAQRRDAHSLLHLYRELIDLWRKEPCLRYGEYRPRRAQNDIFSFARTLGKTEILVGLNLCKEPRLWNWQGSGIRLISSLLDREPGKSRGRRT